MTPVVRWFARRPLAALVLVAFAMAPLLLHLKHLELDTSAEGLVVSGGEDAARYRTFRETFGSDTLTMVVIRARSANELFSRAGLELIRELSDELGSVPGVHSVKSLSTVKLVSGADGFVSNDPLLTEIPSSPEEMSELRERVLSSPIAVGSLVSADGRAASINLFTAASDGGSEFNRRFVEAVERTLEAHRGPFELFQIGAPVSKLEFSRNLEHDQRWLVPWSVAVLLVFLLIAYRSLDAVVIPMATGGLSVLATLGFMAWMDYPVNVVTALVPSILIAVGCTEDVHMLSHYRQELSRGLGRAEAVRAMVEHSALPITLTAMTTVLGFATLAVNEITILRQFGIVASFGLFANFLITIALLPALLRVLPKPAGAALGVGGRRLSRPLIAAAEGALRRPLATSLLTAALALAAVGGCLRLVVNTDFSAYFKEDSIVRSRLAAVNESFAGSHTLNILVDSGEDEGLKDPAVLAEIRRLQDYLERSPDFNKSVSLVDFLAMMQRELNRDNAEAGVLPHSAELVAQYLLLLDRDELETYVDENLRVANVVAWHTISGSSELARVRGELRSFIERELSRDLEVVFTGEWMLVNSSADAMVAGQVKSLALALAAVFGIMSVLFLSMKAGGVAMIANILPILFNFGLMGWLGIPLNTGTCMVAAIALGIAVDDTIHFMVRYQRELRETDSQLVAMECTLRAEGEPIFLTSVALVLGFGVLTTSSFSPTVHFGFLAALVMVFALLADFFVNPMVLLSIQLITLWDFLRLRLKRDITETSPIFRGLRTSEAKKIVLLGSVRSVVSGDYIVRQGEEGHEMFLIISGRARVFLEGERGEVELCSLSEGEVVGEMALVGEGVRSASVVATEPTDLLRIDDSSLDKIRRRFPRVAARLFMNLAGVLGRRLETRNRARGVNDATVSGD